MKQLRTLIMDMFGFSRTETNGMIILLLLIVALGIAPRWFLLREQPTLSANGQELAEWTKEIQQSISLKQPETFIPALPDDEPKIIRPIDPNTASVDELRAIGLPKWLAERITKYRASGGKFKEPDDLRKLYGMTDDIFQKVSPYIRIVPTVLPAEQIREEAFAQAEMPIILFELNSATAEQLKAIQGIGEVLSKRIVEYRERLGGYYSYDQLLEVYGLKPEVVERIRERSTLDASLVHFNFNADSIKHLSRHPYIDWNLAKVLFNYRKVHGDFTSPDDLKDIKILSDSLYQKLSPYLSR